MKPSAIEWIARFRRDRFTLFIVVLAGLGTAHILVRTSTYGAATDSDSVILLSTVMNFLAGEGWRDFSSTPCNALFRTSSTSACTYCRNRGSTIGKTTAERS